MSTHDPLGGLSEADWDLLAESDLVLSSPLIAADDEPSTEELLAPSEELTRVSRRVAAQYAEVLAAFARQALAGKARVTSTDHVEAAIASLLRLAQASRDSVQVALLEELTGLIEPCVTGPLRSRARQSALVRLRDWIPEFAETLEQEDGAVLIEIISWDRGGAPLMEELANLRGIGPRRLGRLYAAGLHNVAVVATADPEEVAAVTGLPLALAERVVEATREYAVEERRRCLESMQDDAARLRSLLDAVPIAPDDPLDELVRRTMGEVESTFLHLRSVAGGSA